MLKKKGLDGAIPGADPQTERKPRAMRLPVDRSCSGYLASTRSCFSALGAFVSAALSLVTTGSRWTGNSCSRVHKREDYLGSTVDEPAGLLEAEPQDVIPYVIKSCAMFRSRVPIGDVVPPARYVSKGWVISNAQEKGKSLPAELGRRSLPPPPSPSRPCVIEEGLLRLLDY